MELTVKIIVTVGIVAVTLILQRVLKKAINRYGGKMQVAELGARGIHRLKTGILYFIAVVVLVLTWGFSLENIWVTVTGFIGLVAIGFFAVWSILSNIFAGVMLFFSQSIKVNSRIEIIPDGISGTVEDISLFFIVIIDDEQNEILVPNNMVYQRIVKRINH